MSLGPNGSSALETWEQAVRALIADPGQRDLVEACYFDPPLRGAAMRYANSAEWQAVRQIIGPSRGTAVDIGAGNGIVSFALASDGWRTIAVEPDPSALVGAEAIRHLALESGLEIEVREGFGEALPVPDGTADLVIARQVLHHARDLDAFCRDIARIMRPGARLVSMRDHVISGPDQLPEFLEHHPLHRVYGGENAFERGRYVASLEAAGLTIEKELGSFDSAINYAPFTHESIRAEIGKRLGPLGIAANMMRPEIVMRAVLKIMSAVDNRPGRLVSFVCRKA